MTDYKKPKPKPKPKKQTVYVLVYCGLPWSIHKTTSGALAERARGDKLLHNFANEARIVEREVLP